VITRKESLSFCVRSNLWYSDTAQVDLIRSTTWLTLVLKPTNDAEGKNRKLLRKEDGGEIRQKADEAKQSCDEDPLFSLR
jgi:hypothetical protein